MMSRPAWIRRSNCSCPEAAAPKPPGDDAESRGAPTPSSTANQAIAVRTAVFREGRVSLQAGAGVVLDSSPEREHEEVLAKARAMRGALSLAMESLS